MFSQQTYDGVEYRMIQTENFCAIKVFATMDYLKMGGAGKTYNYFFFLCFIIGYKCSYLVTPNYEDNNIR